MSCYPIYISIWCNYLVASNSIVLANLKLHLKLALPTSMLPTWAVLTLFQEKQKIIIFSFLLQRRIYVRGGGFEVQKSNFLLIWSWYILFSPYRNTFLTLKLADYPFNAFTGNWYSLTKWIAYVTMQQIRSIELNKSLRPLKSFQTCFHQSLSKLWLRYASCNLYRELDLGRILSFSSYLTFDIFRFLLEILFAVLAFLCKIVPRLLGVPLVLHSALINSFVVDSGRETFLSCTDNGRTSHERTRRELMQWGTRAQEAEEVCSSKSYLFNYSTGGNAKAIRPFYLL